MDVEPTWNNIANGIETIPDAEMKWLDLDLTKGTEFIMQVKS